MAAYDYIIIGAGASGLMLAEALGTDPFFAGAKIALIEKQQSRTNDRTWCFWEAGDGVFDSIVHKTWSHVNIGGAEGLKRLNIAPYAYKMIRAEDFYRDYQTRLAALPNVELLQEEVFELDLGVPHRVITKAGSHTATKVFSSVRLPKNSAPSSPYPTIWQHFIGWSIRFESDLVDDTAATFMDFSVPQNGNTRFMYALPTSPKEVLLEYTLFSKQLLPEMEYEEAILKYIKEKYGMHPYKILEKEKGKIPMTVNDYRQGNQENFIYIGTAGGWSKPSTGYTFYPSYQKINLLVHQLKDGASQPDCAQKFRFKWYDTLLLKILAHENEKGHRVFTQLFKNRNPQLILKFLNEETSLWEDLKIITGSPFGLFLKALFRRN